MAIPDLSRGLLVDPMLEIDAKSKGIAQQNAVGTTLSNVVKGVEQAQDITNNQQVIEQNRQAIQAQEEKLKYLPQQLAIANANQIIEFADKTISHNYAEIESLVGADTATKAMGISESARSRATQFIQATPSEREALFDTPDFAQTVAQSPQLQKLLLPSLNEIIVNRTIGQNTEGLIRAEGLYGSIEGIYKPKSIEGQTEAQLKDAAARQDKALSDEDQRMIQEMGAEAQARMDQVGGGDNPNAAKEAYALFKREQDPNAIQEQQAEVEDAPVTVGPKVPPMQLYNERGKLPVSIDKDRAVYADGSSRNIEKLRALSVNARPTEDPRQIKKEKALADGTRAIDTLMTDYRPEFIAKQLLAGKTQKEAEALWEVEDNVQRVKYRIQDTQENLIKRAASYETQKDIFDATENVATRLEENKDARAMLTRAAVDANDVDEFIARAQKLANGNPKLYQEANQIIRELRGLSIKQAKFLFPDPRSSDAAKELEVLLQSTIGVGDTLEGVKSRLAAERATLYENRVRDQATQFAIDNHRYTGLEANTERLANKYHEYVKDTGLKDPKTNELLPLDQLQKNGVHSPSVYFQLRSEQEQQQIIDNKGIAQDYLKKKSELFDKSMYDSVIKSEGTGYALEKISYSPDVQKSMAVLGRRNPVLYHKMMFGNPKGQAQGALVADGFMAMKEKGVLVEAVKSGKNTLNFASNAFDLQDIMVVAMNESSMNPNAVSPAKSQVDQGYKGLFQLGKRAVQDVFNTFNLEYNGKNADALTAQDIDDIRFDPHTSFMLASGYLNGVLPKHGLKNKEAILMAYNGGISVGLRYQQTGRMDHLSKETKDYVMKFRSKRAAINPNEVSALLQNKQNTAPELLASDAEQTAEETMV